MRHKKILVIILLLLAVLSLFGCSNDSTTSNEPELISFEDDFSNSNSGWFIYTDEFVTYEYLDGKYQIKVSRASWNYWSYAPIDRLGSEYTIQADMIWIEGAGRYGFVFNYVDENNYYRLRVNPDMQMYTVERKNNGEWYNIIDWIKDTENINKVNNHLKLTQNGDKLEIYINDFKIVDTNIVNHSEGIRIGLLVSSLESVPATAQFDNFKVSGYAFK